jgi:AcrR family transcriptional regulator
MRDSVPTTRTSVQRGNRTARLEVSGNARAAHDARHPRIDRRIRRTRDRLGDALIALILEKPFDAITVQEVLDRAGVGRSTFYAHFRDKDDLFLSDADEFLAHMAGLLARRGESSERVFPVRELFAHVGGNRPLYLALASSGKMRDFEELARGHFARAIDARLATLSRSRAMTPTERGATAHALAGALLSLMLWWMDRGMPGSPGEMDAVFHRLVSRVGRA